MAQLLKLEVSDFDRAWLRMPAVTHPLVEIFGRNYGYLTVVERDTLLRSMDNPRQAVVFEGGVNRNDWPEGKLYHVNARVKAMMSAREKKSTRLIVRDHQVQLGDFAWPGGIYKSGFGIGFSGLAPHHDELYARFFLALAVAVAYEDTERNPTLEPPSDLVGGQFPEWAAY